MGVSRSQHSAHSALGLDAPVAIRLVREEAHAARVAHIAGRLIIRADRDGRAGVGVVGARVGTGHVQRAIDGARVVVGRAGGGREGAAGDYKVQVVSRWGGVVGEVAAGAVCF